MPLKPCQKDFLVGYSATLGGIEMRVRCGLPEGHDGSRHAGMAFITWGV